MDNVHWCLHLHPNGHPANSILHSDAEVTRPEAELMTIATLGTAVVDDLWGLRPVVPTSLSPNADVGILDEQQWNVAVVVTKPVPLRNVVEIPVDEVV
jgi:hypothetical protein